MFLGDNILPLLVLALGGAMAVGNAFALIRPPEQRKEGELERAPRARTVVMIVVGAVASVWAIASLVAA